MLTLKLVTADDNKPLMLIRDVVGYRIIGDNFHPRLSYYTIGQEIIPPEEFYIPLIHFPELMTSLETCIVSKYDELRVIEMERRM
jgi:hypothetical protein